MLKFAQLATSVKTRYRAADAVTVVAASEQQERTLPGGQGRSSTYTAAYSLTRPTCKRLVIYGRRLRHVAPQRERQPFLVLLFIGAFLRHTCFPQGQASAAYEIPKHRFRSRLGRPI
jgi:hypothetical protein